MKFWACMTIWEKKKSFASGGPGLDEIFLEFLENLLQTEKSSSIWIFTLLVPKKTTARLLRF